MRSSSTPRSHRPMTARAPPSPSPGRGAGGRRRPADRRPRPPRQDLDLAGGSEPPLQRRLASAHRAAAGRLLGVAAALAVRDACATMVPAAGSRSAGRTTSSIATVARWPACWSRRPSRPGSWPRRWPGSGINVNWPRPTCRRRSARAPPRCRRSRRAARPGRLLGGARRPRRGGARPRAWRESRSPRLRGSRARRAAGRGRHRHRDDQRRAAGIADDGSLLLDTEAGRVALSVGEVARCRRGTPCGGGRVLTMSRPAPAPAAGRATPTARCWPRRPTAPPSTPLPSLPRPRLRLRLLPAARPSRRGGRHRAHLPCRAARAAGLPRRGRHLPGLALPDRPQHDHQRPPQPFRRRTEPLPEGLERIAPNADPAGLVLEADETCGPARRGRAPR